MTSAAAMRDFARAHVAGRDLNHDAFPHDLWRAMGEAGLFRIGLRTEFGGSGGGYRAIAEAEQVLVAEGGSLGFGLSWTGHQLTALWFIDGFASDAQRRQYLPRLVSGELTASVAISETRRTSVLIWPTTKSSRIAASLERRASIPAPSTEAAAVSVLREIWCTRTAASCSAMRTRIGWTSPRT